MTAYEDLVYFLKGVGVDDADCLTPKEVLHCGTRMLGDVHDLVTAADTLATVKIALNEKWPMGTFSEYHAASMRASLVDAPAALFKALENMVGKLRAELGEPLQ